MRGIVLYPSYFDRRVTRKFGRRVPSELAFDADLKTILRALDSLGYEYEIEEKAYPRRWWRDRARVRVFTDESKTAVIRKVAEAVRHLS